MKKIWKKEFSDTLWFMSACFMLGMVAGVIFANLAYPYHTAETETMASYVVQQLKNSEVPYANYIWHLIKFRGERILIVMVVGLTAMATWGALILMAVLGLLFGSLASLMILQFGLQGFLLLMVGMLPQIFVYAPVMLIMLSVIYHMKGRILKKPKETIQEYFIWMGLCLLGYLLGIVLEGYVNLPLLRLFVKKFDFS